MTQALEGRRKDTRTKEKPATQGGVESERKTPREATLEPNKIKPNSQPQSQELITNSPHHSSTTAIKNQKKGFTDDEQEQ